VQGDRDGRDGGIKRKRQQYKSEEQKHEVSQAKPMLFYGPREQRTHHAGGQHKLPLLGSAGILEVL
jgi:hypothetical protein